MNKYIAVDSHNELLYSNIKANELSYVQQYEYKWIMLRGGKVSFRRQYTDGIFLKRAKTVILSNMLFKHTYIYIAKTKKKKLREWKHKFHFRIWYTSEGRCRMTRLERKKNRQSTSYMLVLGLECQFIHVHHVWWWNNIFHNMLWNNIRKIKVSCTRINNLKLKKMQWDAIVFIQVISKN